MKKIIPIGAPGAQAALMPNFVEYETKTTRKIPVVTLERQR